MDQPRVGDHQWWISSMAKFRSHYPQWQQCYDVPDILREIHEAHAEVWIPQRSTTAPYCAEPSISGPARGPTDAIVAAYPGRPANERLTV